MKDKKFFLCVILLFLILLLGLSLRLYKINSPLADHHSWRQADTAAVARNFIKERFDFLRPKIDNKTDLAKPGLPNNNRYFMVEPPLYQTIIYPFYKIFGIDIKFARLVSIIFSLGAIIFLYLLVGKLINCWVGLLAAFFMAILPYGVFYSRAILPEPIMLFTSLGMLYWFYCWLEKDEFVNGLLAWLFTAWSFTLKSFPLFLLLPLGYLIWRKWGIKCIKQWKLWVFFSLAIIPFLLWRVWIKQFPEGIPPFDWLFNQGGIRFRPAFFRWIFAERIGKLILGYWGIAPLILGLAVRPVKRERAFFYCWLGAFLAYVSVFAAGNVTHDYYQIPFIPIASVFLAKGSYFLLTAPKEFFDKFICYLLLISSFLFLVSFSWFEIRGFYLIQGGVDLAGKAVDELTPKNALVLTGDSNDATLLYNTNRYGWTGGYASYFPNTQENIKKAKELGASIYVTTKFDKNSDFGKYMLKNYKLIKETNQYIIFGL